MLYVSQLTKDLDCTVLMNSNFCVIQENQTRNIIGNGTENDGLHYLDRASQKGYASHVCESVEQKLWMWQCGIDD